MRTCTALQTRRDGARRAAKILLITACHGIYAARYKTNADRARFTIASAEGRPSYLLLAEPCVHAEQGRVAKQIFSEQNTS